MAGLRAILYIQFHEWWFRGFGHHFADRRVRTPNTCRHSTEVRSISVLSNSHSVINTNHGHTNYPNGNNTLKTTDCCQICVLVICFIDIFINCNWVITRWQ